MEKTTLGRYIREVMEIQGMSNSQLAKLVGVTEGTIRNLLKRGEDPSISSANPLVIRSVSEVLQLDLMYVFQLAGFVPENYKPMTYSPIAEYLAMSFDLLPPDQQRVLLGLLTTLQRENTISPDELNVLSQVIRELQKAHPMFIERKFNLRDKLGHAVGTFFDLLPEDRAARSIANRLKPLFRNDPDIVITEENVTAAANHPRGKIILRLLLPRKEIQRSIEQLYWLCHPSDTFGQEEETLSPEHQAGIRALWLLLVEQTGEKRG